jgi:hypothetical protein
MTAGFGPFDLFRFEEAQEETQEIDQKPDVLTESMRHEGYVRFVKQIRETIFASEPELDANLMM